MTMADRIRELRTERNLTLEYIGKHVGVGKSTVLKWENGKIKSIRDRHLMELADILGVSVPYLVYGTDRAPDPNKPSAPARFVPLIGGIACGLPILAEERIEAWLEIDDQVHADFALRCVGDSMINARIFDGDIVFIRTQPTVENGEIAAIEIDGEATLKRVYKYPKRLELRPENPLFPVLQYEGRALRDVRILGKAVGFFSPIR